MRFIAEARPVTGDATARQLERQRGEEARERAKRWYEANHERALEWNAQRRVRPGYREEMKRYLDEYYQRPEAQELRRARSRRGAQNRMARERNVPATLTEVEWQRCVAYFGHACAYCGLETDALEQDHFVPLSVGGGYTATNIVSACRSCNASKGNKPPEKWCAPETYGRIQAYLLSL